MSCTIVEISSDQAAAYKSFFSIGLTTDADSFRLSVNDDLDALFPTKGTTDSFTLGAYVESELAGVVSFAREGDNREKLRHKGLLFRMYVAGGYRGQGVGRKLIEDLLKRVNNLPDIEQINLTVVNNNHRAKALYESFGFNTFSTEVNAIKLNDKYLTEDTMVLMLDRSSVAKG
jgi:ribosomal protein S18 acetylase RimI-like enzyme